MSEWKENCNNPSMSELICTISKGIKRIVIIQAWGDKDLELGSVLKRPWAIEN